MIFLPQKEKYDVFKQLQNWNRSVVVDPRMSFSVHASAFHRLEKQMLLHVCQTREFSTKSAK